MRLAVHSSLPGFLCIAGLAFASPAGAASPAPRPASVGTAQAMPSGFSPKPSRPPEPPASTLPPAPRSFPELKPLLGGRTLTWKSGSWTARLSPDGALAFYEATGRGPTSGKLGSSTSNETFTLPEPRSDRGGHATRRVHGSVGSGVLFDDQHYAISHGGISGSSFRYLRYAEPGGRVVEFGAFQELAAPVIDPKARRAWFVATVEGKRRVVALNLDSGSWRPGLDLESVVGADPNLQYQSHELLMLTPAGRLFIALPHASGSDRSELFVFEVESGERARIVARTGDQVDLSRVAGADDQAVWFLADEWVPEGGGSCRRHRLFALDVVAGKLTELAASLQPGQCRYLSAVVRVGSGWIVEVPEFGVFRLGRGAPQTLYGCRRNESSKPAVGERTTSVAVSADGAAVAILSTDYERRASWLHVIARGNTRSVRLDEFAGSELGWLEKLKK